MDFASILSDINYIEHRNTNTVATEQLNRNYNTVDFIEAALNAATMDDIHALCHKIQIHYGFDFFSMGFLIPTIETRPTLFQLYEHESDWMKHYKVNRFLIKDPIVRHCVNNVTPKLWQYHDADKNMSTTEREVLNDARDFGAKSMLHIPGVGLRGDLSALRFSHYEHMPRKDILHDLPNLHLLSNYLHEATLQVVQNEYTPAQPIKLTKREQEVLSWLANGKDTWATAKILNIAETTVLTHVKRLNKKLQVRTRQHAIAKALTMRLIYL